MRAQVEPDKLERLMEVLGREAQGSGCIYFTSEVLSEDSDRLEGVFSKEIKA
ncbi:MAG: hypothetical protein HC860_26240 [Alkalinema sp. RU_4_3]|nr:hypothetical protein [Alkalinema sp. RU_4_3]